MKIYFTASLKGKEKFIEYYRKINNWLIKNNYEILSDHVLTESSEKVVAKTHEEVVKFYLKFLKLVNSADVIIAEVSSPSTNVGHEITIALEKNKPVIVLYTKGNEPRFLTANPSDKLMVYEYDLETIDETLKSLIEIAKDQMDVRFNFFISPKIGAFLDWISKNKKVPRAVYLRDLIEKDMLKNRKYKV